VNLTPLDDLALQGSYQRARRKRLKATGLVLGTSARMPVDRTIRLWSMAALFVLALALGGCSTSIGDLTSSGTPRDAAQGPKEPAGFLPVHDLPPDRDEAAMKPADQARLQADLLAARDRQAAAAAAGARPNPAAK
jgi:hypothetical protein